MRIAIVGSGVSGLVVAHHLWRDHELAIFEAGDHVGGHTHTHALALGEREFAVDTGFIVFNRRTYPNFCALLDQLGLSAQPSDMSFSVRSARTGLEWNGRNLDTVYAQRSNLLRPSFHRMVFDILRFQRDAPGVLDGDDTCSMGEFLRRGRYSDSFQNLYLLPMGAAIWSASPADVLGMSARFFVRFFHNHGFLQVEGRPQWYVIPGGSRRYVDVLIRPFAERIRLHTPVRAVRRTQSGVELTTAAGSETFDHVVMAAHSDQSLAMLADPSPDERAVLGAIRYQTNEAVLHTDESLLPRRAKCRASWNYHLSDEGSSAHPKRATVTYWMNLLQSLDAPQQLCVTLNHSPAIDPTRVLRRVDYHHPRFDLAAVAAQKRWAEINVGRTSFCGAYWRYGFHEDGVRSGLRVVEALTGRALTLESEVER